MTTAQDTAPASSRELIITRLFNAPRALVFQAWTDPRHLAQWWGPHGFSAPVCEVDLRPGGTLLIHMRGPDGVTWPMRGVFDDVVPPERLVFTAVAMADDAGQPLLQTRTAVTFAEDGQQTRLTLRVTVLVAAPAAAGALGGMEMGWNQSLEKLQQFLSPDAAPPTAPNPALRQLDPLIGAWSLSSPDGSLSGQESYEWLDGGYFLLQRVDMLQNGQSITGIQLIGYERKFGELYPRPELTGRWFENSGGAYDYVWQPDGDRLTIWAGFAGSLARYDGVFSADGNTRTGRWQWPGGGYEATATRLGLTILRTFAAPRETVFQTWTQPRHFARWFGMRDSTMPLDRLSMDPRPGGAWRGTMLAGPERHEIHWAGVYLDVAAPERLVFTLTDQPDSPEADICTVLLAERDGQTHMTFHQRGGHLTPEGYAGARAGWLAFFERLAELVQQG